MAGVARIASFPQNAAAMKPRVAVIGPVYPYRGAIPYCTGRLALELRRWFDITILSFRRQFPQRWYPGASDRDQSVADQSPPGARFGLDIIKPWTWLNEGRRLRKLDPRAVVIVWWVWVWAIPYLMILAMLPRRTRVIVQCHNIGDKEPGYWKSWLANRIFRRADLLVVHSRLSVTELVDRLGEGVREKTLTLFLPVLPIGKDVPDSADAKRRLGLEGKDVALFFGFIRPYKGLDIALRAWKQVDDAVLLVVGEAWFGEETKVRDVIREEQIEQRVRLELRFVPDSEAAWYWAAADVVVTPYRYENQSAVAMTAFHFGLPVIATRVGGLPDIVEDGINGFLVAPENPAELAGAINRYFAAADRAALREGARQSARKYSWEEYGSRIAERIAPLD
jgi:glycosyltransferase involved in cell wall biosynthesis